MSDENREEVFKEECRVTVRLLELMQDTHYELVQINGQRRLTAPDLTSELKNQLKGAEVFIGGLPHDCYEDEIMPIVSRVGRVLELRLMLNFSRSTRGYAFALFENAKVAKKACEILDGYAIRPGHKIGVVKSIDNCRLFFGGVPKDKTKEEFAEELGKLLDGISDIYLYPSIHDKNLNRGFLFVEFKDHRAAAMARRQLVPGRVVLWDHEVAVDWAEPEPGHPVDGEIMDTVSALFVRNLDVELHQKKLKEIFQSTTGIPIVKLKKINHFAFIHYETREMAQSVMDIMSKPGGVAEHNGWEICWAKPVTAGKHDRQRSIDEAIQAGFKHDDQLSGHFSPRNGRVRGRRNKSKPNSEMSTPELPKSRSHDMASPCSSTGSSIRSKNDHQITDSNFINFRPILDNYVMKRFGAHCQLHCMQLHTPPGFVCKISIVRDDQILLELTGPLMANKAMAVNLTSRDVYYRLINDFGEPPVSPASVSPHSAHVSSAVQPCH